MGIDGLCSSFTALCWVICALCFIPIGSCAFVFDPVSPVLTSDPCPSPQHLPISTDYCAYVTGYSVIKDKEGKQRHHDILGGAICLSEKLQSSYMRADMRFEDNRGDHVNISIITLNNFVTGAQYVMIQDGFPNRGFLSFSFNSELEMNITRQTSYLCSPAQLDELDKDLATMAGYHALVGEFGDPLSLSTRSETIKSHSALERLAIYSLDSHSASLRFQLNVTYSACTKRIVFPQSMYFAYTYGGETLLHYFGTTADYDADIFRTPRQCHQVDNNSFHIGSFSDKN